MEQKTLEENLNAFGQNQSFVPDRVAKFLELANGSSLSYEMAFPEEKRDLIKMVTSNRTVEGKKLTLEPSIPFALVINRFQNHASDPTGSRSQIIFC